MKKIVGTILAASLALTAFAAEPAANFVMSEFTGSAEFGWKADFTGDDVRMGMYNAPSASLKFGFVDAGTKATTGDGIWGELEIGADATSVTNGAIKLGNTKAPADGGTGHSGNIDDQVKTDGVSKDVTLNLPNLFPAAYVKTAKIHLVNGDFNVALNLLKPGLKYGAFGAPAATGSNVDAMEIGNEDGLHAGLGLELGMDNLFALNFKFMDDGFDWDGVKTIAKDKKYGLAFDVAVTAVPDLTAKVMGTFNFAEKYNAFAAEVAYKLGLTDTMYVKPGAAFAMKKVADTDAVSDLMAGVLFGWGAADQEPGFAYVANKTTEGLSVGFDMNLNTNDMGLKVGLYDQSLANLLGISDILSLKTGVFYGMTNNTNTKVMTNTVAIGERAVVTFSPVYVELGGDFQLATLTDKDNLVSYGLSVKLGSKEIIDNTDVFVSYNFGNAQSYANPTKNPINAADGTLITGAWDYTVKTAKTNNITIGTKISF